MTIAVDWGIKNQTKPKITHSRKSDYLYANNKGADQPAHPCSVISAFVILSLESIIAKLATFKMSNLSLVSVVEQVLSC